MDAHSRQRSSDEDSEILANVGDVQGHQIGEDEEKYSHRSELDRNSMMMETIRSILRMARRRGELRPLRRRRRITAETRMAMSWSSARAWKI